MAQFTIKINKKEMKSKQKHIHVKKQTETNFKSCFQNSAILTMCRDQFKHFLAFSC